MVLCNKLGYKKCQFRMLSIQKNQFKYRNLENCTVRSTYTVRVSTCFTYPSQISNMIGDISTGISNMAHLVPISFWSSSIADSWRISVFYDWIFFVYVSSCCLASFFSRWFFVISFSLEFVLYRKSLLGIGLYNKYRPNIF